MVPCFVLAAEPSFFDFSIKNAKRRSSTYWFPLVGMGVPGLPQFLNGQKGPGIVYSGGGALFLGAAIAANPVSPDTDPNDYNSLSDRGELYTFSLESFQVIGALSTYHAFRSTVLQRKERGDFYFLVHDDETTGDLLLAPFQPAYLLEPTVIIPLGVLAAAVIVGHNSGSEGSQQVSFTDGAFLGGISYGAGVSEEILFRGYLMMNLRQSWGNDFWSLAATSTLFGAAHISSSNPVPWPQLLAGFYFGWLTERNQWTLSRSIFLHSWWDVIAFAAEFSSNAVEHKIFLPVIDLAL
jgi:hypothetical protein